MRNGGFTESVPGVVDTLTAAVVELAEPPHAPSRPAANRTADGFRMLIMPNSLLPREIEPIDARGQSALL